MSASSKEDLQAMGVSDRSRIIIVSIKVIAKHNQLRVVKAKVDNLNKKVNSFKSKFQEQDGPSFILGHSWKSHLLEKLFGFIG